MPDELPDTSFRSAIGPLFFTFSNEDDIWSSGECCTQYGAIAE